MSKKSKLSRYVSFGAPTLAALACLFVNSSCNREQDKTAASSDSTKPIIKVLLVAQQESGEKSLAVWATLPDTAVHMQHSMSHANVYVDGRILPVNDHTGGEPQFGGDTLPKSVVVMFVDGSDTMRFRMNVPAINTLVPSRIKKTSLDSLVASIQQQLSGDQSVDLLFDEPPDHLTERIVYPIQFSSRLEITKTKSQRPPNRGNPADIHSEYYVPLDSLVVNRTYRVMCVLETPDVRVSPLPDASHITEYPACVCTVLSRRTEHIFISK